jgi:hypothetical protein
MTTNQGTWDNIYNSLRDDEIKHRVNVVNVYELTNYIDELYDKIAELERRLDRQEKYD